MCGIAGFVGHRHGERELHRGIGALHHRGPDGQGTYLDPAVPLGLGHARLSIIDLQCGGQPLYSEDGNLVLVCNGEIYDFERLRGELETRGHRFATHSDSEVILHLYEERGAEFMQELRGEFAFLLYDRAAQVLLAVRDRFGIKPLFFHAADGKYLFGSEAKAIFAMGPLKPKLDVAALRDALSLITPDAIFEGIDVVPPGCMLRVDLRAGTHEIVRYWDLDLNPTAAPEIETLDEAIATTRAAVDGAIRVRLRADVPVGVYLSGGIDSAIVAAATARMTKERLKVFTVAFPEDDVFNEYQIAQNMAKKIGAEFFSVRCDHAALVAHAVDSLWTNELPFFNFHGVGKFLLSALAREHVTVVLTGEGSDEVFLGYDVFRAKGDETPNAKIPAAGSTARRFHDGVGYAPGRGFRVLFSGVLQGILRGIFHKERRPDLRKRHPLDALLRRVDKTQVAGLPDLRRRQYLWIKCMLPQYILTMLGDRSELAHAIEGRTPFLDHHLFEKARRIPDAFKIHDGVEKHVLREAYRDELTEEIYRRQKWPYTAPPLWIRTGDHAPLDELIAKHLSPAAIRRAGIFSPVAVDLLRGMQRALFFDCPPKRAVNSFLLYVLTVQVLHQQYEVDFEAELHRRLPA